MDTLLERFCRYVRIHTQADEQSKSYPSSPGQLELGRLLQRELLEIGLQDATQDEHGIVLATIPATSNHELPTIAWIAHVDTSPETTGLGVKPIIHRPYDGRDIVLPGDLNKVIRVADNPDLAELAGKTIITSDGTTLLGSDDKSGVAVIMEAAARLAAHPEIVHGPIRVCFTCDEEIGRGVDHLSVEQLGAQAAYTLDGGGVGEIDVETFSGDLAVVTIRGVNIHPAIAKNHMVNAIRLAAEFLQRLPTQTLSPESTSDREGFLHPYRVEGGVPSVSLRILLRDFVTAGLKDKADLLRTIAADLMREHPKAQIEVAVTEQYRNMAEGLVKDSRVAAFAEEAMRRAGLSPKRTIVRGGTDGSHLTKLGLPTPNLSTGEHNLHSPLEWTCLEEMEKAVQVLIELAQVWAGNSVS